ncbi:hypothetical protein [Rhizobacter sp. LjRoot28]|uniref:hypothetical protein n=1 Tax=Rhizobacter sp. LjRoot28 TaxID=3342309 RepID=UPI003ECC2CF2
MNVGISELASSLRVNTADAVVRIRLGHGHQLICAALGYKTLASYQAAQTARLEPQSLERVRHVLPDYDLLADRARELGVAKPAAELRTLVDRAFGERLPSARLHGSYAAMTVVFQDEVQNAVFGDDDVNAEMAGANYDGVEEVYLETELEPHEVDVGQAKVETLNGHVTLGIDTERPYSGHQVMFEVAVTTTRSGLLCFDALDIEVLSAQLDQDWGDDEPDDHIPTEHMKTLAQAFAERLKISENEAQELVDAEPQELTGSSGEMTYGYLFDFEGHASPKLAKKLRALHGSLELEVDPAFFGTIHADVR